jgi:cytochrome c oxidase subunit 2
VRRRRHASILVAGAVVLVLSGCGGEQSMLDAKGNEAQHVAGAWWVMFGLATAVYVVVAGFILTAVVRGRRTTTGKPSRIKDGAFVWIGGIIVPAIVLLVIAVVTVRTTAALRKPERDALRVEITARDWWWDVRYPDQHIRVANEFHLPVGRPIELRITSDDVIHSFWVPQIGGKLDAVPGQPNFLRFTIEKTGVFRGQCAEYCGIQHANMAMYVHGDPPGLFERWIASQQSSRAEPASEMAARGALVFQSQACAGCHTVRGTAAQGTRGPELSDVASRRTLGAGALENTPDNLRAWITNPQRFKPGAQMPPIPMSSDDRTAIVAYLETLR